jgi:hypothetical protein
MLDSCEYKQEVPDLMSKQYILVTIAFVAMLGVVGCSDSDKTTAPVGDTVAPTAVEQLDGQVIESQNSVVNLGWKAGPELDLAGYHVYRSVDGGASVLVATTTQSRWSDSSILKGADYIYEVAAFDDASNEGARASTGTLHIDATVNTHDQQIN